MTAAIERCRKVTAVRAGRWVRPTDLLAGSLIGILAASNLVQGAWGSVAPWLDLTTFSFALLLPLVTLRLATFGFNNRDVPVLLAIIAATSLGFFAPALNPAAEGKRIQILAGVLFPVIAGYLVVTNIARLRVLFGAIVTQSLVVLAGILFSPDQRALEETGRLTPDGLNAIGSGRVLATAVLILAGVAIVQFRRPSGWVALAIACPLLWASLATGSRGPIVAAILAAGLIGIGATSYSFSAKVALMSISTALLALIGDRLSRDGSRLVDSTDSGRTDLFTQTAHVVMTHPFGIGWGNLYNYLPVWLLDGDQGWNQYAHNIILEFAVEAGWAGAVLFGLFAFIVMRRSCREIHVAEGAILAVLLVFAGLSAMLSSDVVGNRMLWVLIGVVLSSSTILKDRRDTPCPGDAVVDWRRASAAAGIHRKETQS